MARVTLAVATTLLALCMLSPSGARATVLVEVPLDDMIFDAEAIVMGEVSSVDTQLVERAEGRMEPWTVITIRVERWLKSGTRERETITLYERGGSWQGGGMHIAGTPEYEPGERVVTFLWRDPLGRLRTYGMSQGKFVVHLGVPGVPSTASRDFHDVAFAEWQQGRMSVGPVQPITLQLDAFLERIEQVLEAGR